jgi:hypothetical protein
MKEISLRACVGVEVQNFQVCKEGEAGGRIALPTLVLSSSGSRVGSILGSSSQPCGTPGESHHGYHSLLKKNRKRPTQCPNGMYDSGMAEIPLTSKAA